MTHENIILYGAIIFVHRSTTSKHRKFLWNFRGALGDEIDFNNHPCFFHFSLLDLSLLCPLCVNIASPPLSCHLVSVKGDWVPTNILLHSSMTSGIPFTISKAPCNLLIILWCVATIAWRDQFVSGNVT